MTDATTESAIEMYNYHGQLGLKRTDLPHCCVIQDAANPDVWGSNKVFAIRASTPDEITELMNQVDDVFGPLPYRHFVIDPLTPEPFAAYLALHGYAEYAVILQMLLTAAVKPISGTSQANIKAVASEADWVALRRLVLVDHQEGARTHSALSQVVTDGIIAGYRAKSGPCQFFIVELDGQHCAYGSGTIGPNGLGMVEDLFTLPECRRQGLASKLISHCVEFCRDRGAHSILIGSHAGEAPKHLYNRLGFNPLFLTRDLIKPF